MSRYPRGDDSDALRNLLLFGRFADPLHAVPLPEHRQRVLRLLMANYNYARNTRRLPWQRREAMRLRNGTSPIISIPLQRGRTEAETDELRIGLRRVRNDRGGGTRDRR
jgi:hypothetical protein